MFKKLTAIAILVGSLPVMAYAATPWMLNTWARSAGGSISVNGVSQNNTNGSVFTNFTSGTSSPTVTVSANTGYTAYCYTDATGTISTATPISCSSLAGLFNATEAASEPTSLATLWVVFRPGTLSVTAAGDSNSTVNLKSLPNVFAGSLSYRNIDFVFHANNGYVISAISGTGSFTVSGLNTIQAKVTIPSGYTFNSGLSFVATSAADTTKTTASASVSATPIANGSTVTLTGTYIGATPAFENFSCVSKPAGATQPFAKATATASTVATPYNFVTPALGTNGTYVFQFRAGSGNTGRAITSVTVAAASSILSGRESNLVTGRGCQNCHTANGIASGNPIYANYSSYAAHANSTHSACTACHLGTGTGGHPGSVNSATVNVNNFFTNYTGINGTVGKNRLFCTYCHNGSHPVPHPVIQAPGNACSNCHAGVANGDIHSFGASSYVFTGNLPGTGAQACTVCHVGATSSSLPATTSGDCVACHNLAIQHPGAFVNDNSGVRQITGTAGEFGGATTRLNASNYRSHHIYNGTNLDPVAAQCIACHLEGTVGPNETVVLNPTYHMADAKVHLRSGNSAISADFAWDPANPDQTGMDNFCMSCHNGAGAVTAYANISSALIGAYTNTLIPARASAKNPFGDLLKNAYDGLTRPQVVAVYEQFDTGNVAHHAVRGQKYSGAYRPGNPHGVTTTGHSASTGNFTQYSGAVIGNIHIVPTTGLPQVEQYFGTYSTSGPASGFDGGQSPGSRKTLYEAGLFVSGYTTLDGATVGDDSNLHCGDCHSVGQWKPGSANYVAFNNISNAQFGYTVQPTTVPIGAHGAQNEYMLRTSNGADKLHTQGATSKSSGAAPNIVYRASSNGTYVCYLCHLQSAYGDNNYFQTDAGVGVTAWRNHAGVHYNGACDSSSNQSVGKVGYANRITTVGSGKLGSVFGYTCANCHSSGNQTFGGIHGAASADGTVKNLKFLTYSTDGTDIIGKTLPGGYTTRSYAVEHDTLTIVQRLPYRFMGGASLRYNGGGSASKWEAKALNGSHREGCYNISATTNTANLWNTTNPQAQPNILAVGGDPGGNASATNSGNDSAWLATDYSVRYITNNQSNALYTATAPINTADTGSGWGACNHHQGVTTSSSTAVTRSVQRPLVY